MRGDDGWRRGGGGGGGGGGPRRCFKVLCPESLVAAVIGHRGAGRDQLQQDTGCHVKISSRDDYYPGTRCRILVASAADTQNILDLLQRVMDMTVDLAHREGGGKGGTSRDDSEVLTGRDPGEFVLRTALPHSVTGAIIGPRGERIKQIRATTGAKVFVENEAYDRHQMARVIGLPEAISLALPQILGIIDEEMPEDLMAEWSRVESFDQNAAPVPGKGGSLKGKGGGKGGSRKEDGRGRGRSRSRSRGHDGWQQDGAPPMEGEEGGPPPPAEPLLCDGNMLEALHQIIEEFPPERNEMQHAVTFDMPSESVREMLGPNDEHKNWAQGVTATEISVSPAHADGNDTISIQGPLQNIYAAHALLMKRYHEAEIAAEEQAAAQQEEEAREQRSNQSRGRGGGGPPRGGAVEDPAHIAELQSKMAALRQQIQEAKRDDKGHRKGGGSKGGGKGKGKRR